MGMEGQKRLEDKNMRRDSMGKTRQNVGDQWHAGEKRGGKSRTADRARDGGRDRIEAERREGSRCSLLPRLN